jgi:2'-5' RNA ligase
MRLFIAIELEELSGYFKQLQEKIPNVKATFPKRFHLTLKFLGEVEEGNIAKIKEALSKIKFSPFKMKLSGTGVFPNERFIRVVWAGMEDGKAIEELQQKIEDALAGMFKKDNRFHPHITLARVKFIEEDKKDGFIKAIKSIEVEQKEAEVKNFKLVKSTLTGEGPVYEDLEVFG